MYTGFSRIVVNFEVPGDCKVTKIGGKPDKRGTERLGEQKNVARRVKEMPERAPGTLKVRFIGGQEAL